MTTILRRAAIAVGILDLLTLFLGGLYIGGTVDPEAYALSWLAGIAAFVWAVCAAQRENERLAVAEAGGPR